MKLQFNDPSVGTIFQSQNRTETFLPAKLPPTIQFSAGLATLLSNADAALGALSGAGDQLPNPALLINSYLNQEAVLSTRIEGTRASLAEVLRNEVDPGSGDDEPAIDILEVRNYVRALIVGIQAVQHRPLITLNLVKELHDVLMADVRGRLFSPGQFRTSQNFIGARGSTIAQATFVPPAPEKVMECLTNWEQFVNLPPVDMPVLVQCAIMHEQFETIHPFLDGNGRLGRVLIPLFLMIRGRLSQPLLYLSVYLERYRDDYIQSMQRLRSHGDYEGWLSFFLNGVEQIARQALDQAKRLLGLREELRQRMVNKPNAVLLIDSLFVSPYMTSGTAVDTLGVAPPTARRAIGELVSAGIVTEITQRERNRVYEATAIMAILNTEPTFSPE